MFKNQNISNMNTFGIRILCATKTSYTKPDLLCFGVFRGVLFIHWIISHSFSLMAALREPLDKKICRSRKVSSLYYSQIQNKQIKNK